MPRIVREARLQERTARARLAPRHHPYWRAISQGRHLGYYKGRVAERGTHAALVARGGLYAEMWARQQAEREAAEDDDVVAA